MPQGPFREMQLDAVSALLGSDDLPGTEAEQAVLAKRIAELVHLNGKQWVVDHRRDLLREWRFIVAQGILHRT